MKTIYAGGYFRYFLQALPLLFLPNVSLGQDLKTAPNKTITIKLEDEVTHEAIPFGNVVVYDLQGTQIAVATTNMEGECAFNLMSLDDYIFKGIYVGYKAKTDTISCNLPACIRYHAMSLKAEEGVFCGEIICCCCFVSSEIIQDEEDAQEFERTIERTGVEAEILNDINDFVCYPNPTNGPLKIKNKGEGEMLCSLFNNAGQCLRKQTLSQEAPEWELDLSNLPKGCYLVVCSANGLRSHTKTIIVQ